MMEEEVLYEEPDLYLDTRAAPTEHGEPEPSVTPQAVAQLRPKRKAVGMSKQHLIVQNRAGDSDASNEACTTPTTEYTSKPVAQDYAATPNVSIERLNAKQAQLPEVFAHVVDSLFKQLCVLLPYIKQLSTMSAQTYHNKFLKQGKRSNSKHCLPKTYDSDTGYL